MNKLWLSSIVLLCFVLVACSNQTVGYPVNPKNEEIQEKIIIENKEDIKLVASEKNLPSNFSDLAFIREESPRLQYLVNRVDNQKGYEEVWKLYRLEQQIANVNLEENDVYFIVVFESGSCPYELDKIKMSIDNDVMKFDLSEPNEICTADETPITFVVEVNKEISNDVKNVVLGQSRVETIVPINDGE